MARTYCHKRGLAAGNGARRSWYQSGGKNRVHFRRYSHRLLKIATAISHPFRAVWDEDAEGDKEKSQPAHFGRSAILDSSICVRRKTIKLRVGQVNDGPIERERSTSFE